jgi:hypothetical protein
MAKRKNKKHDIRLIADAICNKNLIKKKSKNIHPYKAPLKNDDVSRWILLHSNGSEEMIFIRSQKQ